MSRKRDNAYWKGRLIKDGHDRLIERVDAEEITMYRATQLAGYRLPSLSKGSLITGSASAGWSVKASFTKT